MPHLPQDMTGVWLFLGSFAFVLTVAVVTAALDGIGGWLERRRITAKR